MKEDLPAYTLVQPGADGKEVETLFSDLSKTKRLEAGVKVRLQLMSPYIDKWPQAMALGLQPVNIPTTLGQIHAISDEIWF